MPGEIPNLSRSRRKRRGPYLPYRPIRCWWSASLRLSEAANAATLLEAAYRETEGTVKVRLRRVHGTVGELKLDHAVQIMEHTCSDLASKAEMIEVRASRDAVMNDEEGRALDQA